MAPHKDNFILNTFNYKINQVLLFQYPLTALLKCWAIEVALEQYGLQHVEQVHLHGILLVVNE